MALPTNDSSMLIYYILSDEDIIHIKSTKIYIQTLIPALSRKLGHNEQLLYFELLIYYLKRTLLGVNLQQWHSVNERGMVIVALEMENVSKCGC